MSKKLLSVVIGSSIGGLLFIFIMLFIFSPETFLKPRIKQGLIRSSGGRVVVEDITFGWRKGLELSNFILLRREERRPEFQAQRLRLKAALLPLLRGQYVLRELEASDMEVASSGGTKLGMAIDALKLRASHLTFTGELAQATPGLKETKHRKRLEGGGVVRLEDGLLGGQLVSILMKTLGQSGEGYAFKSISTNFDIKKDGNISLLNFLAKSDLFDLELGGSVRADGTLDCDTTVILSKENMTEQAQKLFNLSGSDTLRIPMRLRGTLSKPKVSIKTGAIMEEIFKDLSDFFREK